MAEIQFLTTQILSVSCFIFKKDPGTIFCLPCMLMTQTQLR